MPHGGQFIWVAFERTSFSAALALVAVRGASAVDTG
jgi:hypothetical protein